MRASLNVANAQSLTPARRDAIVAAAGQANPYARLLRDSALEYPLWDETAAAVMACRDLVTRFVVAYADVEMGFDEPDLGRLHVWGEGFAPAHSRRVNYVLEVDQEAVFERVAHAVVNLPKVCS